MADSLTKEHVLAALKTIKVPGGQDVVSAGLLSEIVINKGKVYFALNVPQGQAQAFEPVRKAAEGAVKDLAKGVDQLVRQMRAEQKVVREWVDEQAAQQSEVASVLKDLAAKVARRG